MSSSLVGIEDLGVDSEYSFVERIVRCEFQWLLLPNPLRVKFAAELSG